MKIRKFNENWKEKAFLRKDEYYNLLDDVLEAYKEETSNWMDDKEYNYAAEMYDLLSSLINNLEIFDDDNFSYKILKEKLEKINKKQ